MAINSYKTVTKQPYFETESTPMSLLKSREREKERIWTLGKSEKWELGDSQNIWEEPKFHIHIHNTSPILEWKISRNFLVLLATQKMIWAPDLEMETLNNKDNKTCNRK